MTVTPRQARRARKKAARRADGAYTLIERTDGVGRGGRRLDVKATAAARARHAAGVKVLKEIFGVS